MYVARSLLSSRFPHPYRRARLPIIDFHVHLAGPFSRGWSRRPIDDLPPILEAVGVETVVNLDGTCDEGLDRELLRWSALGDRVAVFAGIREASFSEGDRFGEIEAQRLARSVRAGACGLKVWKTLGMSVRDPRATLVALDDDRLSPLWHAAGDLGIPVLIHVADPIAFFQPLDRDNERWDELRRHPEWHRLAQAAPSHSALIEAFERVLDQHRGTRFVAAHLANLGHDLARLSVLLARHPNLSVDISSTLNELGRQPEAARRLFEAHQSRILFGSDTPPSIRAYMPLLRFLETADEHFSYSAARVPSQGRWLISGIQLPERILSLVYAGNARQLLGKRALAGAQPA
jgi:predicted TIM-barrel fold metal-dependent hydrolase